jgi:hypothetical protein
MLGKVTNMLNRATALNERDAWNFAVTNNYTISNAIKKWIIEQHKSGKHKDSSGELEPFGLYSFATEKISEGRKIAGRPYTFDDTGAFHASIVVVPKLFVISIYANGDKGNEDIIKKYGLELIDLISENKVKLKEIILDEYIKYIKKTIL